MTAQADSDLVSSRAWFLLGSGAVQISHADRTGRVDALVTGNSGRYDVHRTVLGEWTCSCGAQWFDRRCSHVAATQLVTVAA